jgi:hypothetical protein
MKIKRGTLEAKRPKEMKYLKGTPILLIACGGYITLPYVPSSPQLGI